MSDAQAAALGMLTPAAGVAAMQGLLLDLAAARSPRAAGVASVPMIVYKAAMQAEGPNARRCLATLGPKAGEKKTQ